MLNRYATAILGSLGTILVLTSYVAMYRNGTEAIYLGLLGFALIGSAMLVQRVNDLVCQVEDLEDLERDYNHQVDATQRYIVKSNRLARQVEDLEWELEQAKAGTVSSEHVDRWIKGGAFST